MFTRLHVPRHSRLVVPRQESPAAAEQAPPLQPGTAVQPAEKGAALSTAAGQILAVIRIAVGFVFLWAFADKLFGWQYATPAARAWVNGGSPTSGFLSGVDAGPFQSTFHAWAGAAWADWLFMLGLLGIGVAVTAGVALRAAAVSGTVMLAMMWVAEWPPAQFTSGVRPRCRPTRSSTITFSTGPYWSSSHWPTPERCGALAGPGHGSARPAGPAGSCEGAVAHRTRRSRPELPGPAARCRGAQLPVPAARARVG
jgi:thiosulfate dehydrogenase [quinone] large subunit